MKSFCLLAFVLSVVAISMAVLSPEERHMWETKILDECKPTVDGVTDDDISQMLAHEPPKTQSGKCLAACVQQKIGFVADGKFSVEGTKAVGAKQHEGNDKEIGIFNEIVDECSSVADDDKCELASKIFECLTNGVVKRGFNPKEGIKA